MHIPKKTLNKEILSNKYVKIIQKDFLEKNGDKSSYLIYAHNKKESIGTFVMPILPNGDVLYIKEYRAGPEKVVISFPVGMLEDGISEIENCKKELEEETGYTSNDISYLTESIIENYFEGKAKFYIAKNCVKISNQDLELGENISVHSSTVSEFYAMILNGEVNFAKTISCFFIAKEKGFLDIN